jgi:hypothetical protein
MTDLIATIKDIVKKLYANELDFWSVIQAIHQLTEFLLKYKSGDLVFGDDEESQLQLRSAVDELCEASGESCLTAPNAYGSGIGTTILISVAIRAIARLLEHLETGKD